MSTVSDQELIQNVLSGNSSSFEELVKRYKQIVAATAINMLGDINDAEEIGQETFIRFYKSLEKFRGDSTVSTYLTRICINLCLNRINRNKIFRIRNARIEYAKDVAVGDEMKGYESRELVQKGLMKLNAKYRAVINLRMIQEYSTRETAEILSIPEGTVLSRLKRGMDKLKTVLIDDFGYE